MAMAVAAATSTATETRHADAHVHGTGSMNFAIDDQRVFLDLTAPGFDLLGFETISSDSQRQQLKQVRAQLRNSSLWSFPADAVCSLVEADSHVAGFHDEDNLDDNNDKEHENSKHFDFSATYVYQCQSIENLNSISTNYFKIFSRANKLTVQGITSKRQTGGIMTRNQPTVHF